VTSVQVVFDNTPPSIHSWDTSDPVMGQTLSLWVTVTDVNGVGTIFLNYSVNDGSWQKVQITSHSGDVWDISVQLPIDAIKFDYNYEAEDTLCNPGISSLVTLYPDDPILA